MGPERARHRHGAHAGGGYGTARLYGLIDWSRLGAPRIVCGFSDITALHLALAAHAGWVSFYGPNFSRFTRRKNELTRKTEAWFHRAFKPEPLVDPVAIADIEQPALVGLDFGVRLPHRGFPSGNDAMEQL